MASATRSPQTLALSWSFKIAFSSVQTSSDQIFPDFAPGWHLILGSQTKTRNSWPSEPFSLSQLTASCNGYHSSFYHVCAVWCQHPNNFKRCPLQQLRFQLLKALPHLGLSSGHGGKNHFVAAPRPMTVWFFGKVRRSMSRLTGEMSLWTVQDIQGDRSTMIFSTCWNFACLVGFSLNLELPTVVLQLLSVEHADDFNASNKLSVFGHVSSINNPRNHQLPVKKN